MPRIPAMIPGMSDLKIKLDLRIPMEQIPTPDLAVP